MSTLSRILLIEADRTHAQVIRDRLCSMACSVEIAATREAALECLRCHPFDILIYDVDRSADAGGVLRASLCNHDASRPAIYAVGPDRAAPVLHALRGGAHDYVVKDSTFPENLARAISGFRAPPIEANSHRRRARSRRNGRPLIGSSDGIAVVREQIRLYSDSEAPILIEGETGTGKELVARALHDDGPRHDRPFVPVNCAAIAPTLFETELFGCLQGAYTGAVRGRRGFIEEAADGTLFLDEISELPISVQAKLLRLIENREYRPVGAARVRHSAARVVAATNCNLQKAASETIFRRDLYYRLSVLRIVLPPLRQRRQDIPVLVEHFVDQLANTALRPTVAPEAYRALLVRPWHGNVRELRHVVERTLIHTRTVTLRSFEVEISNPIPCAISPPGSVIPDLLRTLLSVHEGRLEPVASDLGVSVRTVERRMKKLGLVRAEFRRTA